MNRYVYSFWAMARPLFIVGIGPLYALGITAAWSDGRAVRIPLLISGLCLVWLIQLMTHYNNEYCDLETDLATEIPTRISGGSRVLVRKLVSRASARTAAVICLLLAVVLAMVMVLILGAGLGLPGFLAAAVFLGWFYSARPLKLQSQGSGEMALIGVSCFLLPATSYYLQTGTVRSTFLPACAPIALLTLALILTTGIPDLEADKATGKKTLVVRLGRARAMGLITASLAAGWLAFVAVIVYLWPFWGGVAAAVSLPLLAAIGVFLKSAGKPGPHSLEIPGLIISLLVGYASICLALAFIFK